MYFYSEEEKNKSLGKEIANLQEIEEIKNEDVQTPEAEEVENEDTKKAPKISIQRLRIYLARKERKNTLSEEEKKVKSLGISFLKSLA